MNLKTPCLLLLQLLLSIAVHAVPVVSIPANNAHIEYNDRVDFADPLAPRFSYSGVSIRAHFQGTSVSAIIQNDCDTNLYNVIVDGVVTQRITLSNGEQTVALASGNYSATPTGLESPNNMKNRYERIHWDDATPLHGFSRTPDLICVNLGTNDFSAGVNEAAFEQAYHDFIDMLQSKNPGADIICLVGPMVSGYNLARLRIIVPRVAATANARNNGRVFHFEMSQQGALGTGAQNHPNVAQHALSAQELTAYIRTIKDW